MRGAFASPSQAGWSVLSGRQRGCSSMVEQQPSKLNTRVRFPVPAPITTLRRHRSRSHRVGFVDDGRRCACRCACLPGYCETECRAARRGRPTHSFLAKAEREGRAAEGSSGGIAEIELPDRGRDEISRNAVRFHRPDLRRQNQGEDDRSPERQCRNRRQVNSAREQHNRLRGRGALR